MSTAASRNPALAWWQLLRGANVFTAASNVIAGFLLVQAAWQPIEVLAALVAASMCLYLSGMVLNDVFDARLDAVERPERPIPSGRVAAGAAAAAGFVLLVGGVGLAWTAAWLGEHPMPGLIGVLLAFAILQYDRRLKHTWVGPLAMGWCRFLNVLLGASVSHQLAGEAVVFAYAALVGGYALALTNLARSETVGAVARMVRVRKLVSLMIMGFVLLDAAAAAYAASWQAALAVLCLLIPTIALKRWAPMT